MALESPETTATDDRQTLTFYIQKEYRELIYSAADALDVSVSSLLRSIIYEQTDGFMKFVSLPDPTPTPGKKWSTGRPRKKAVK